jgi:alpha-beta hydrolase superfamily lysophospholipase
MPSSSPIIIRENHPDLPVFLFGHSMGSMMAQQYIQNWGGDLAGAILSGSTGLSLVDASVLPLAEQAAQGEAADQPSELFMGLFASVNEPFAPVKTPFDWLSRDEAEVQKYIDDPWCGFAFTNGMTYEFMKGMVNLFNPENEARIPKDLLGLDDVSYRLYPGARHEILNETNRDEVHADIVAWLGERA